MKEIDGDLIQLALNGEFDIIVHGCNCFCTMGSGIALQIKLNFPLAYNADLRTKSGDSTKLGTYSQATEHDVMIINAYTQYRYGREGDLFEYESFRNICKSLSIHFSGKRIGFPMIGCGLAGGNWETVSSIIAEELGLEDVTIVKYKGK